MNYQEIYDKIVFRAKLENRKKLNNNDPNYVYYEAHHILPECMYPQYSNFSKYPWNKILLTGREHYIAHQLLSKIYPDNNDLFWAVHKMTSTNIKQTGRSKNKLYQWLKHKASKLQSIRMLGSNNPMFGRVKDLHPNYGVKRPKEFCLAQSLRMSGENNNNFGNPNNYYHTDKTKNLIGKRTKEALKDSIIKEKLTRKIKCDHCNMLTTPSNIKRWHNENCKNRQVENKC